MYTASSGHIDFLTPSRLLSVLNYTSHTSKDHLFSGAKLITLNLKEVAFERSFSGCGSSTFTRINYILWYINLYNFSCMRVHLKYKLHSVSITLMSNRCFNKYQQKQSAIQETTMKNTFSLLPYSQMIHHLRALLKAFIPVSVTDLKHYHLGLA